MMKTPAVFLVLFGFLASLASAYNMAYAPRRNYSPYREGVYGGDYNYGGSPYRSGGRDYYTHGNHQKGYFGNMDWGNFSPNYAYHTNGGYNSEYNRNRYNSPNNYEPGYYNGYRYNYVGGYNNRAYNRGGYDNYYYRPDRYMDSRDYGYNRNSYYGYGGNRRWYD